MDVNKKNIDNPSKYDKITTKEKQVIIDTLRQIKCVERKLQELLK